MFARDHIGRGPLARALCALLLALPIVMLGAQRAAAQDVVTFTSAVATWHDAVANTNGTPQPSIVNGAPTTNATPTTSSVSWGTTTGSQSGYDVSMAIP